MTAIHTTAVTRAALCFALITWLWPAAVYSQTPAKPAPSFMTQQAPSAKEALPAQLFEELTAIKSVALADDYAYRQLAHLTENIGPRQTGSAQADAAAEYVAGELRSLGLEVHLEEVEVPRWVRGAETAQLVEYAGQAPGTSQKIVLTALGGSSSTAADGIIAGVVVVNNFDELKALGREKIAGKIVVFNEIFDKQKAAAGMAMMAYGESVPYRAMGPKAAADLGAAAALVRSVGSADYRLLTPASASPLESPRARSPPKMRTSSRTSPHKARFACI
jgi:carboxypeptidase Q